MPDYSACLWERWKLSVGICPILREKYRFQKQHKCLCIPNYIARLNFSGQIKLLKYGQTDWLP